MPFNLYTQVNGNEIGMQVSKVRIQTLQTYGACLLI